MSSHWNRASRKATVFLAAFLLVQPAFADNPNPLSMPSDLDTTIRRSLNQLYSFKFDAALSTLEKVQDRASEHPMLAFAIASAHWWRLSVFVLETDEEESRPFLEAVQRAIQLSENKIKTGDPKAEGHLVLGGALGLWGRFETTNRNWLSAYFKGKKAVRYLERALDKNPRLFDADMGLGMFHYYVATLPSVVRVLAFLGAGASKEAGIEELEIAAFKSAYAGIPSKLFLVDVYTNTENNEKRTFEILNAMKEQNLNSPYVHFLEIVALYNFNRRKELQKSGEQFIDLYESGTYVPISETVAYFSAGLAKFKMRQWRDAIDLFDRAVAAGEENQAFHDWAVLFKGYSLTALERNDEAQKAYARVLRLPRRWNSHDNARRARQNGIQEVERQVERLVL